MGHFTKRGNTKIKPHSFLFNCTLLSFTDLACLQLSYQKPSWSTTSTGRHHVEAMKKWEAANKAEESAFMTQKPFQLDSGKDTCPKQNYQASYNEDSFKLAPSANCSKRKKIAVLQSSWSSCSGPLFTRLGYSVGLISKDWAKERGQRGSKSVSFLMLYQCHIPSQQLYNFITIFI